MYVKKNYVLMYVCMYEKIDVYMKKFMYVCMYKKMYVCMYVYINFFLYVC